MERAADMSSPVTTTAGHLRRELRLLELLLRREVIVARAERGAGRRQDEFAGLYIPDEEISRYLEDTDEQAGDPGTAAAMEALDARVVACREELKKDVQEAERQGFS